MAITESKLHANLNRDKILDEAWWLTYVFCCGRAIGDVGNPYCASESYNICIYSTCNLTDNWKAPVCSSVGTNLCITSQMELPPTSGAPACVCFNQKLAGGDTGSFKKSLFDFELKFDDTFWIYYIGCMGCGVNGIGAGNRPLFGSISKQFWIEQSSKFDGVMKDGIMCSGLGTQLCCWSHVQIPPADKNPGFACCGFRTKKSGIADTSNVKPMSYGKGS